MNENERPQETPAQMSRRAFLKKATGVLALVSTVIMGIPIIGSIVGATGQKTKSRWSRVTKVDSIPAGAPVSLSFTDQDVDAYLKQTVVRNVWAMKNSPSDVTVYSPICPHLGCAYNWDAGSKRFSCPCHGSIFDTSGKVLAGPSARALDALPTKIEDGDLLVQWVRYQVGIPEKKPV